jgi:hypothetical protein
MYVITKSLNNEHRMERVASQAFLKAPHLSSKQKKSRRKKQGCRQNKRFILMDLYRPTDRISRRVHGTVYLPLLQASGRRKEAEMMG